MKVTGNVKESEGCEAFICNYPIVVVVSLLLCSSGVCVVIPSSAPAVLLSTTRYGLSLKGCCFRLQKVLPLWQVHQTEGSVMG